MTTTQSILPSVQRLDVALVERGLAESRNKAQAYIRAGQVRVDGQVADKPGQQVTDDALVEVRHGSQYASRAGPKLAHALTTFGIRPHDWCCLDVGASTGGFTDALLQSGARRVYAVDVGRGQLAWRLRTDPRVVCMERTDIRDLTALPDPIRFASIDVAFISLRLVLPAVRKLLVSRGEAVALVKPQFEAGRESVPRGGVVRDEATHRAVLLDVLSSALALGLRTAALTPSPVLGLSGNQEYLVHLAMPGSPLDTVSADTAIRDALSQRRRRAD